MKEVPIYNQLLSLRVSGIVDILVDPDFTLLGCPFFKEILVHFFWDLPCLAHV